MSNKLGLLLGDAAAMSTEREREGKRMRMHKTWPVLGALAATGAIAVAGCGGSGGSSTAAGSKTAGTSSGGGGPANQLVGAGSTLVAPLVGQWQGDFNKKSGITVTYGAIGSGGGISAITARTVDFGASDAPLTSDQQAQADKRGKVVQVPWALAATVVAYNVKGVKNQIHLTGPVLADIYLGKVTKWNDPAIAKLNPGTKLPSTKITPIYRSDGSGDTYALTDYLSKVSPQWKSKVGNATQVKFPTGIGGKGNSGVGGALQSTDGSIAYIAISYVFANKFDYADIRNAAGKYPAPSVASIAAAADTVGSVPADNAISITNPPASAASAYPISTFTYALVPAKSSKAKALTKFLSYAITDGQSFDEKLYFAHLPAKVLAADRQTISKIGS